MNGPVEWYAAASGILAALMIAWDHSRQITGWGFVLFVTTSIAWIAASLVNDTPPLAVQNAIMLAINGLGAYRYLIRKKEAA